MNKLILLWIIISILGIVIGYGYIQDYIDKYKERKANERRTAKNMGMDQKE